jgi:UDP-N-acetylglucosamine 1-carboxyvinyltransferase
MGAKIDGIRNRYARDRGRRATARRSYEVMPDRIEAGSYACAAGITGGEVELVGARADTMAATMAALSDAGLKVEDTATGIRVAATAAQAAVALDRAVPGLPHRHAGAVHGAADAGQGHQPADRDDLREPLHARAELTAWAPRSTCAGRSAVVRGVDGLVGAPVMATDLRASMSLIIAGPRRAGETQVHAHLPSRPRL